MRKDAVDTKDSSPRREAENQSSVDQRFQLVPTALKYVRLRQAKDFPLFKPNPGIVAGVLSSSFINIDININISSILLETRTSISRSCGEGEKCKSGREITVL